MARAVRTPHRRRPLPRWEGRISPRAATAGLVIVLIVLTAFASSTAVVNARAADKAQDSAVVRELADQAEAALAVQEDLADDVVVEPSEDLRAEYDEASLATGRALRALADATGQHDRALYDSVLARHSLYSEAVLQMFAYAESSPGAADDYETEHVDPHYDALSALVTDGADEHWHDARGALVALGASQRLLLVVTPAVFGLGLLLLAVFTRVLRAHRRELDAHAADSRHRALHDALTDLPNRALLLQRVGAALSTEADGGRTAVLFLDLDQFKEINDGLGHHYGDLVLQSVADRLRATVRTGDTAARLGGDEFAVVLPGVVDVDAAVRVAEALRATLRASIDADGVLLDVEASIGVVVSGLHGDDAVTLLQHADIAMYAAKERGLGVCVYDSDLVGHTPESHGLLGELRRAIDGGELVLHFQPKVDIALGRVCGVEALVRWQHPERGLLLPGLFIPVAERTALIRPLTRFVVDAALEQCRRWRDAGRELQVAVNVSARNLHEDGFVEHVRDRLTHWGLPPDCLELEVTESAIMADPARARSVLSRFDALGVRLSIDDFGAGYTSLAHLKNLPVHQLKIDRSFVSEMTSDRSDALIVRSVVDLAHNLGLTTVAEGVEDEGTWERLSALGCDIAQGYLLTRPLPAAELEVWLDRVPVGAAP